jgi:hypothetical protein
MKKIGDTNRTQNTSENAIQKRDGRDAGNSMLCFFATDGIEKGIP